MPERKQPHGVLLTNPIVRGPGYGIAASLAADGYPVHVTADHSLPGMFTSSRFFASVNRVDAPRGTLLHGVRIRPNSAAEDLYLRQLLDACSLHGVRFVLPATEVDVVFLARNRERFAHEGVDALVPTVEQLIQVSDKYSVIETARRCGFPVAEAVLCSSLAQLHQGIDTLGCFPLILKARSGMGSSYVWRAKDRAEVEACWEEARSSGIGELILQRCVTGGRERSFNYLISPAGEILCAFALAKPHHALPSQSTSVVVIEPPPELHIGAQMLKTLGITGFAAIQTIHDASDGQHKIIEINARLGSNSRILHGMGINLASWWIESVLHPQVQTPRHVKTGSAGVCALESLVAVRSFFEARSVSRQSTPTIREFGASYLRFLLKRPSLDVHLRNVHRDFAGFRQYAGDIAAQLRDIKESSRLAAMIPWGDLHSL